MTKFGVFIRGTQSEIAIIDKCRKLLQSFQSDVEILHIAVDQVHNGVKVYFNSGSCVSELLKKKFLSEEDDSLTIHSLTTDLSVNQAFFSNELEFKDAIRDQISVQVLEITKVPIHSEYPDIGFGKWIIVLDIPGIEDLDEFKTMGLPNGMVLKFPAEDLSVKFYCRRCQKDGHVQSGCLDSDTQHSSSAIHSSSKDRGPKERPKYIQSHPENSSVVTTTTNQHTFKRDIPSTFAPPIDHEQYPVQRVPSTSGPPIDHEQDQINRELPSTSRPSTDHEQDLVKQELTFSDDDDEDSNIMPLKCKKKLTLLPVVIPDRIRDIISGILDVGVVLDVGQLQAFFNHVKKKSKILDVALEYTQNVDGLYSQLAAIKVMYYSSPSVGSKEDKKFMKMLESVMKRFYNTSPQ